LRLPRGNLRTDHRGGEGGLRVGVRGKGPFPPMEMAGTEEIWKKRIQTDRHVKKKKKRCWNWSQERSLGYIFGRKGGTLRTNEPGWKKRKKEGTWSRKRGGENSRNGKGTLNPLQSIGRHTDRKGGGGGGGVWGKKKKKKKRGKQPRIAGVENQIFPFTERGKKRKCRGNRQEQKQHTGKPQKIARLGTKNQKRGGFCNKDKYRTGKGLKESAKGQGGETADQMVIRKNQEKKMEKCPQS